jgi:hypothetical protein
MRNEQGHLSNRDPKIGHSGGGYRLWIGSVLLLLVSCRTNSVLHTHTTDGCSCTKTHVCLYIYNRQIQIRLPCASNSTAMTSEEEGIFK